jgi:hypothetical protein
MSCVNEDGLRWAEAALCLARVNTSHLDLVAPPGQATPGATPGEAAMGGRACPKGGHAQGGGWPRLGNQRVPSGRACGRRKDWCAGDRKNIK